MTTSDPTYDAFFRAATGGNTPYAYQRRLAGDTEGTACATQLIAIPTDLGKTAAVVLAWLWNRVALNRDDWPRRLVYCLPMRTLVEQTRDEIIRWLENLETHAPDLGPFRLAWLETHLRSADAVGSAQPAHATQS